MHIFMWFSLWVRSTTSSWVNAPFKNSIKSILLVQQKVHCIASGSFIVYYVYTLKSHVLKPTVLIFSFVFLEIPLCLYKCGFHLLAPFTYQLIFHDVVGGWCCFSQRSISHCKWTRKRLFAYISQVMQTAIWCRIKIHTYMHTGFSSDSAFTWKCCVRIF